MCTRGSSWVKTDFDIEIQGSGATWTLQLGLNDGIESGNSIPRQDVRNSNTNIRVRVCKPLWSGGIDSSHSSDWSVKIVSAHFTAMTEMDETKFYELSSLALTSDCTEVDFQLGGQDAEGLGFEDIGNYHVVLAENVDDWTIIPSTDGHSFFTVEDIEKTILVQQGVYHNQAFTLQSGREEANKNLMKVEGKGMIADVSQAAVVLTTFSSCDDLRDADLHSNFTTEVSISDFFRNFEFDFFGLCKGLITSLMVG